MIQHQYAYDSLGQLIREDNRATGKSYVYAYDAAGNITSKKTYAFTTGTLGTLTGNTSYSYSSGSWGDLLTYVSGGVDSIQYDAIGNPIKIGEAYVDNREILLSWKGRELQSYTLREVTGMDDDGNLYYDDTVYTFTYNEAGIRTSKTVNGIKHEYVLNGSQILAEKWKIGSTEYLLVYLYDETGTPIGIKYRTSAYEEDEYDCFFFEKDLQGDIVSVYNESGTKIGSYTYDAWGNHTYSTASGTTSLERKIVSTYNPFRYRGYYYDVETSWYYLQTRYYNPNWCRFLNADASLYSNLLGFNLFAYCYNDPVNYIDPYGENGAGVLAGWVASSWWLTLADGPLPIGDIIVLGGLIICSIAASDSVSGPSIESFPVVQPEIVVESFPVEPPEIVQESFPTEIPTIEVESIPVESSQIKIEQFSEKAQQINILYSKHGKQNVRHTQYRNLTDQQVIELYKNPSLSKQEKKKLDAERKGRGLKNIRKRKEQY